MSDTQSGTPKNRKTFIKSIIYLVYFLKKWTASI